MYANRKKSDIINEKRGKMLIKNKYTKKSKLDELRADYELIRISKRSKERTAKMFRLATELLRMENINNKK